MGGKAYATRVDSFEMDGILNTDVLYYGEV
jgi:hypothetical protein